MDTLLGVRIDSISRSHIDERLTQILQEQGRGVQTIFTPNPEMLVDASRSLTFRNILNRGSLNICDGVGITLMTGGRVPRYPGIDLMQRICARAEKEGCSIYLLGGAPGVAEKTKNALIWLFPMLKIVGSSSGPDITMTRSRGDMMWQIVSPAHDHLIKDLQACAPDIIFVAFGHGKQEWWIDTFKSHIPQTKIMMGVGGSFDVLSGTIPRAPYVFRRIGMEWLWRLLQEPHRIKRIINATIIFPWMIMMSYARSQHKNTN